jgi:hypothetical protein
MTSANTITTSTTANDNNNPDFIYVEQNLKTLSELSSIHPQQQTTHPSQLLHVLEPCQVSNYHHQQQQVTTQDIQSIANDIFERKGRGITYLDLIKGRYKCVDTNKQAQNILYYHKKRGNLYTDSSVTIPQQYYLKQDAEYAAAIQYKKYNHIGESSTHPHPTGVNTSTTHLINQLTDPQQQEIIAIQDRKADSITEAIELIVRDTKGHLPVGIHNIRLSLRIQPQYAAEVYYERLSHIPESGTKERSKKISTIIDGFKVDAFFYPNKNRQIVIIVSCSERPFPIGLNSPDRVSSDFTSFVAQIRRFICSHLSDYRGRMVPPIHNANHWRILHADINWDIPVTTLQYLGMDGLQITKVDDIVQRIYRKRINGKRFIRVEEGVRSFPQGVGAAAIDNSIGETLIEAAKEAKKKLLLLSMAGGGEVGGRGRGGD